MTSEDKTKKSLDIFRAFFLGLWQTLVLLSGAHRFDRKVKAA